MTPSSFVQLALEITVKENGTKPKLRKKTNAGLRLGVTEVTYKDPLTTLGLINSSFKLYFIFSNVVLPNQIVIPHDISKETQYFDMNTDGKG